MAARQASSIRPSRSCASEAAYGDGPGNTEHAFDAATGTQLWNSGAAIGGPVFAAPMVANGQLIVPSWDHHVYAFGP